MFRADCSTSNHYTGYKGIFPIRHSDVNVKVSTGLHVMPRLSKLGNIKTDMHNVTNKVRSIPFI
jgi:hypothetical protein